METKFTVPLIAIMRLIKMNPTGVEKNALQFRSGLSKEDTAATLTRLQEQRLIEVTGKGRGTKYIKGPEFDKACAEL